MLQEVLSRDEAADLFQQVLQSHSIKRREMDRKGRVSERELISTPTDHEGKVTERTEQSMTYDMFRNSLELVGRICVRKCAGGTDMAEPRILGELCCLKWLVAGVKERNRAAAIFRGRGGGGGGGGGKRRTSKRQGQMRDLGTSRSQVSMPSIATATATATATANKGVQGPREQELIRRRHPITDMVSQRWKQAKLASMQAVAKEKDRMLKRKDAGAGTIRAILGNLYQTSCTTDSEISSMVEELKGEVMDNYKRSFGAIAGHELEIYQSLHQHVEECQLQEIERLFDDSMLKSPALPSTEVRTHDKAKPGFRGHATSAKTQNGRGLGHSAALKGEASKEASMEASIETNSFGTALKPGDSLRLREFAQQQDRSGLVLGEAAEGEYAETAVSRLSFADMFKPCFPSTLRLQF